MAQEIKIIVKSNFDSVRFIGCITNKICQELNIKENDLYNIELAVVEACNNVVEHAHKEKPQEDLIINFIIEDKKLEIQVHDKGSGIKLKNYKKTMETLDPKSESSRGIAIIKKVMDEVYYDINKKGNVMRMIKHRS